MLVPTVGVQAHKMVKVAIRGFSVEASQLIIEPGMTNRGSTKVTQPPPAVTSTSGINAIVLLGLLVVVAVVGIGVGVLRSAISRRSL
jgi:hypothetical protein